MKIVNTEEFRNEIKEGVVVVDFFATWCAPCTMLAPVLEELDSELANVKFIKVDVDASPELSAEYKITNIPALAFIKDGEMQKLNVGFAPKEIIKELAESYL